jgi:hypothetical protein
MLLKISAPECIFSGYFIGDNGNDTCLNLPVSLIPFWRGQKRYHFGMMKIASISTKIENEAFLFGTYTS